MFREREREREREKFIAIGTDIIKLWKLKESVLIANQTKF